MKKIVFTPAEASEGMKTIVFTPAEASEGMKKIVFTPTEASESTKKIVFTPTEASEGTKKVVEKALVHHRRDFLRLANPVFICSFTQKKANQDEK